MDAILQTAAQWGVFPALAIFLIWQQRKDNDRLSEKLQDVEVFCRTSLLTQLNETSRVVEANTEAMRQCRKDREHAEALYQRRYPHGP